MANRLSYFDEYNQDLSRKNSQQEDNTRNLENFAFARSTSLPLQHPWAHFNLNEGIFQPLALGQEKVKRKRKSPKVTWKKPQGMPKRPLSAYNLFFRQEREKLLNANRQSNRIMTGIGFAGLARQIAAKWKTLDSETKSFFQSQAWEEKQRYKKQVETWKQRKDYPQAENQEEEKVAQKAADENKSFSTSVDKAKCETKLSEKALSDIHTTSPDFASSKSEYSMGLASLDGFEETNPATIAANRAQSDSLLELCSDVYKRPYELASTCSDEGQQSVQKKLISPSLTELVESLDEDSFAFLADLNHPDLDSNQE
mmetsp:Transcript_25148/g.38162  ORF Transcript_25148/g.38162 Transcript_25148/m.38162 type:complete len:313 (-) Transcript_25148:136-1074(-)